MYIIVNNNPYKIQMPEYVTKSDLLESENKVLKEDQRLRHNLSEQVHIDYLKIDEKVGNNDKELALLKQSHNTMSENIKEIKEDMKEGFINIEQKMDNFFEDLPKYFATKEEYKINSVKIESISEKQKKWDKGFIWALGIIGAAIIGAILKLIFI